MRRLAFRGGLTAAVVVSTSVVAVSAAVAAAVMSTFSADLRDYSTTTPGAFDHARAELRFIDREDVKGSKSTAVLRVRGIDLAATGQTFGAHLHDGPCETDQPALALGHYNVHVHEQTSPVEVSPQTEIWLDFTVDSTGSGDSATMVRFTPEPGARSVVIHANPTNPDTGAAGPRLACLPVQW